MGVVFLEPVEGSTIYACARCKAPLVSLHKLESDGFQGATGTAYLFSDVVNVIYSKTEKRGMITGIHIVRDISCKKCQAKLGWFYEWAEKEAQRYKEGKFVLERSLITKMKGVIDRETEH